MSKQSPPSQRSPRDSSAMDRSATGPSAVEPSAVKPSAIERGVIEPRVIEPRVSDGGVSGRGVAQRPAGERAPNEAPSAAPARAVLLPDGLSASERDLLAAARRELQRDHVPAAVRQRLFERTLDEARRVEPNVVQPASLVPVRARGVWLVLGSAAAMAASLVLFASARPLFRSSAGEEPLASGELPRPQQQLGDRIFQSALFRAPAPAWSGALPPVDTSLFRERPFSPQSHAWQIRHWNDLAADPGEPAKYHFDAGALCVTLRPNERVIGGWPWLPNGAHPSGAPSNGAHSTGVLPNGVPSNGVHSTGVQPNGVQSNGVDVVPAATVPAPVALSAGKAYRLVFKAWAADPMPSQLLIAVGHAHVPFSAAAGARVDVSTTPEPFVLNFVAKHDDPSIGVAFLANAGQGTEPTRVCLSDMTLSERPR